MFLWSQSLYLSRRKNRHRHWVCWTRCLSRGRENGLMWRTHIMWYLSYPVRWQVIALSTLLTALQCRISVSWFCDHRACISRSKNRHRHYWVGKKYMHTRVPEFWNTHPPSTASPFGRINLKPSQSTASKSRSPHSVRVRVGLGWSVSGSTPNPPLNIYQYVYMYLVLYTWNQVFTYIIIVVVLIVHLIVGAFQTRAPGCASNNVTWKSIHFSIYSFVFFAYRIMHGTGDALWNHSSK